MQLYLPLLVKRNIVIHLNLLLTVFTFIYFFTDIISSQPPTNNQPPPQLIITIHSQVDLDLIDFFFHFYFGLDLLFHCTKIPLLYVFFF